MSFDLTGRVALVTGASRGLGAAMARALARHGATVALHGSRTEPAAVAAAMTAEHGVATVAFAADLSQRASADALIAQTLDRFGAIDILVNNAGIIRRAEAEVYADEDWDAVLEVNLS